MSAGDDARINPHIPQYISELPWYLADKDQAVQLPSLKHQRASKLQQPSQTSKWYKRGMKKDDESVGRKFAKGACTNCGATTHKANDCVERPRRVSAKKLGLKLAPDEFLPQEEMIGFEAKRDRWGGYTAENFSLDAAQRPAAVQAPADEPEEAATGGKALRIREDTAKYLINLDVDSAFFDPKSRSMREDPTVGVDEERKTQLSLAGKL